MGGHVSKGTGIVLPQQHQTTRTGTCQIHLEIVIKIYPDDAVLRWRQRLGTTREPEPCACHNPNLVPMPYDHCRGAFAVQRNRVDPRPWPPARGELCSGEGQGMVRSSRLGLRGRQPQETRDDLALLPDRRLDSVTALAICRITPEDILQHHHLLRRAVWVALHGSRLHGTQLLLRYGWPGGGFARETCDAILQRLHVTAFGSHAGQFEPHGQVVRLRFVKLRE